MQSKNRISAFLFYALLAPLAHALDNEPIAYIGHGAFFETNGKQIDMTQEFVTKAQLWYQTHMLESLTPTQKKEFGDVQKRLHSDFKVDGQARLLVQQSALEWLFTHSTKHKSDHRLQGKLRALTLALALKIPERSGQTALVKSDVFLLNPDIAKKFKLPQFDSNSAIFAVTANSGQAYLNECMAAQVPIPPTIGLMDPNGTAGWKSQGFIPTTDQFIEFTPAEVRTFTSPQGMCVALPRYVDGDLATVKLDGVICLSKITSKVCFWDNQRMGRGFLFPAGAQIPIGVPDLRVDLSGRRIDPSGRYQAGGYELLGGTGGVCTDCHAGENPYIIHPNTNLGSGLLWGSLRFPPQSLPMFSPNRYDPIVAAAWPQNQLSQTFATTPEDCRSCHVKGDAGRFPHLSSELFGYCNTVLRKAIGGTMPRWGTMPPFDPGSAADVPAVANFARNWCNAPPNRSSADAGDPHITTTNGVHYDFQAAGEFVALKNSDTDFELQTRQSPVLTTFTPGVNPYTGLASCVSLNTAVALRMGKHRVTYQRLNDQRLQLKINGAPADPANGINLGNGNVITQSSSDGALDVQVNDGTRLQITPLFWASQGYWYLDISVLNTPAREGVMGHVLAPDWLPAAPDGASFGPRPAALADRHFVLNKKFADAWRVTTTTTMFDYAPGTSTADFTDPNWPSGVGKPCTTTTVRGPTPRVSEPNPALAKKLCAKVNDPALRADCIIDVTVMGDAVAAQRYIRTTQAKTAKSKPKAVAVKH